MNSLGKPKKFEVRFVVFDRVVAFSGRQFVFRVLKSEHSHPVEVVYVELGSIFQT